MQVLIAFALLAGFGLAARALSANAIVQSAESELVAYKVKGTTHIYRGALVGLSGGYARGLVAADGFVGIATEEVNNTGADGAAVVQVKTRGLFLLTGSGFAATDVGASCYASADDTITKTSSGNSLIGVFAIYVSSTQMWVRIG